MTVRQLHYTSVRYGRDGHGGFQVAALSPGVAPRHEDLALPLSAYRPPPSASVVSTVEEIAGLPVAFGYRMFDGLAVLFCSRYLGVDFTGRQGNYFAHVLLLDAPRSDLAELLPAETWDAPLWTTSTEPGADLAVLDAAPAGPLVDRHGVREQLRQRLLPDFEELLAAVARGLAGDVGRVVVVAPVTSDVALLLAAVTRSLPTVLALQVSFTTYSAAPADVDLLVVGTTPDVTLPPAAGRDRLVVHLADAGPGRLDIGAEWVGSPGWAGLLGRSWAAGVEVVEQVVALADRVDPPLWADELDRFADLAELALADPGVDAGLGGLEFAVARFPATLTADLWARLDTVVENAELTDVRRWSAALAAATQHGPGPGPQMEARYLAAVLTGVAAGEIKPSEVWFPRPAPGRDDGAVEWALRTLARHPTVEVAAPVLATLARRGVRPSDEQLVAIADLVVVPALLDIDADDAAIGRVQDLAYADRLLSHSVGLLDERLGATDLFDRAVEQLSVAAATLLAAEAGRASPTQRAALLALARAGGSDRVQTAVAALGQHPDVSDLERYVGLLWAGPPGAADGVALCRAFDRETLAASTVPTLLVQRLVIDAGAGGLGPAPLELAAALRQDPVAGRLSPGSLDVVDSVQWADYFRVGLSRGGSAPDRARLERDAGYTVDAAAMAGRVDPALGRRLLDAVACWLLALESSLLPAEPLRAIALGSAGPQFLPVYAVRLAETLATAPPAKIAAVLPTVVHLAQHGIDGQWLLDTVCRDALARRRPRDLEQVGAALEARKAALGPRFSELGTPVDWPVWWREFRVRGHVDGAGLGRAMLDRVRLDEVRRRLRRPRGER